MQGRWALLAQPSRKTAAQRTAWSHDVALQLLNRYGVVTRETAAQENLPGGFSAVYEVLKAMEASGRIRRGYFAQGLGAAQFALRAAVDMLRSLRAQPETAEIIMLAAADPANLYGSVLRWPQPEDEAGLRALARSAGASIVLRNGELVAYLRRDNPHLQVFLPVDEPDRTHAARDLALFLAKSAQRSLSEEDRHARGLLIATVNGVRVQEHWFAQYLLGAGFSAAPSGFNVRRASAQGEGPPA